jgi:hypothetical protein
VALRLIVDHLKRIAFMAGIKKTLELDTVLPLLDAPAVHAAGDANPTQEGTPPTLAGVVIRLESGGCPVRIVCFGDSITGVYYHSGGRRAWCDLLGIGLQQAYPLGERAASPVEEAEIASESEFTPSQIFASFAALRDPPVSSFQFRVSSFEFPVSRPCLPQIAIDNQLRNA